MRTWNRPKQLRRRARQLVDAIMKYLAQHNLESQALDPLLAQVSEDWAKPMRERTKDIDTVLRKILRRANSRIWATKSPSNPTKPWKAATRADLLSQKVGPMLFSKAIQCRTTGDATTILSWGRGPDGNEEDGDVLDRYEIPN